MESVVPQTEEEWLEHLDKLSSIAEAQGQLARAGCLRILRAVLWVGEEDTLFRHLVRFAYEMHTRLRATLRQ